MKHITSTVLAAGAQKICAASEEHPFPGMGSIALQPSFRPVLRREVMSAVNTCSRDLGLRQGAVVVLDALLSCLPCQGADGREIPVTPATLLTVFASNETLCFRAKGLTDRQLRRHLETLEKVGLLLRRDSANGKRFPMTRAGKPIAAFGLDLSPLFAHADALMIQALRHREEAEELRGLRAQILRLRATCLELPLCDKVAAFVDGLRNLLRRSTLSLVEARAALDKLTAVITGRTPQPVLSDVQGARPDDGPCKSPAPLPVATKDVSIARDTAQRVCAEQQLVQNHDPMDHSAIRNAAPCAKSPQAERRAADEDEVAVSPATISFARTDETAASDGQDVRHKETESDTKKRRRPCNEPRWSDLTEVSAFYREPRTRQEAAAIIFEFGKMLRISQPLLAKAADKLGLWELLRVEDRLAKQAERIQNPDAYLISILRS